MAAPPPEPPLVPGIDTIDPGSSAIPYRPTPDFLNAKPANTIGMCLSGGGNRAVLYHIGAIIRMNEMGLLPKIAKFSCVSGGAIVGAQLAMAWQKLRFNSAGVAPNLIEEFATPLIRFTHVHADVPAVLKGLLKGLFVKHAGPAMELAEIYDKHLFHGVTMSDIPDYPKFVFQSTNLQTLENFEFSKSAALDDRVGVIYRPAFRLARAVAASSAYPPFLSPVRLDMSRQKMEKVPGSDLYIDPYTKLAVLTDGGVRDNMGLMSVLKDCCTVFISNAGSIVPQIGTPTGRWIGQFARVVTGQQLQSEEAHEIMLNGLVAIGQRKVALWKIQKPVTEYGIADPMALSAAESTEAANIPTRITEFKNDKIALAMRVGYANADASLRAQGYGSGAPRGNFPNLPRANNGCVGQLVQ